jgi:hypothetical protein
MENHECPSICSSRYMGSFRWWMRGGIAFSWTHVICLDNTSLPRGVTRFARWRQDLHAIELLRAQIGEWTINSDVGLLKGYVLYWLLIELEFMDLDTFSRWFGMHSSLHTSW